MATPGWYPDPSGQPNSFRYWDGQSWSEQTTPDPYSPPPGTGQPPAAPTQGVPASGQYGGGADPFGQTQVGGAGAYGQGDPYGQQGQQGQYGQQGGYGQGDPYGQQGQASPYAGGGYYGGQGGGYGTGGPGGTGGSGGSGKKIALIVLAVVLVLGLAVGGFFGVRALSDDGGEATASDEASDTTPSPDESESTDESESPSETPSESESETPSETPSETGPTGRECTGGLPGSAGGNYAGDGSLTGGGLELPPVQGYGPMPAESAFTFADGVVTIGKQIEEQWISLYALGALPKESGYYDLEQAADQVIECMAQSENFYRNFTGRTDLDRGAIDVAGAPAYSIRTELRVNDPAVSVDGDVAEVVVVDIGHPDAYGLYVSVVPIGNDKLIRQQETVTGRLQLD